MVFSVKMAAILMYFSNAGEILSRVFVSKPMVAALCMAFSGSTYAVSDTWRAETVSCYAPVQTVVPAKGSGGARLAEGQTRITADQLAGQTNVRHRATGDVIVERNDETLNAEWVDYNQQTDTVTAGDAFTLTRADGQTVTGEQLNYHLGNKSGQAHNAEFAGEYEGRRLQGVSGSLNMESERYHSIQDVKFNTCNPGDRSWYIQAAEVSTDRETGIGVAKHARLVFGGVPVLYTPWADFPINGNRKSGLLVPNLEIGSDGTTIALPYYLNLAPNYDATVTPEIITARGARISGEFRYLQPNYSGNLSATYMPEDKRSQHQHRSGIKINHLQRFSDHLSGGINFTQVSDDDYYRDFYGRNEIAESTNLDRNIWLNYGNTLWGGPFSAQLSAQNYQTLSDANGYKSEPYAIRPRLAAQWQKNLGTGGQFNISTQATRFAHPDQQEGSRFVAYPSIQWDFHNTWGYIRPKIGLHASYYHLNRFNGTAARNETRVLPIANIDSGITLERQIRLFANDYIQTLEPRLFYNYIPKKAQNHLPNFDTSENVFSYEQLFRENIYSGGDRINASNSVALGLQTRLLDRSDGSERFRAGIGQKYYFSTDNILLDGQLSSGERNHSDFTAFAGGRIGRNWFADTAWHWSQSDSQTRRFDLGVRYNPEAGKILSARYKFGSNEEIYSGFYGKLKHIDLAAQWPIKANLYAVGRLNYSITPFKPLEQTLGLEYKNPCGCWSVSVVAQRYVTALNSYKNAFFFTLQLKDLSNIGNNPYEQLRLGIPGYSKTNEVFSK